MFVLAVKKAEGSMGGVEVNCKFCQVGARPRCQGGGRSCHSIAICLVVARVFFASRFFVLFRPGLAL